ncbi:MAG TPA: hypothetical protein VM536_13930 [Chloroflexia bacterium]|nr:hypothetical protein [Chloroflexia bacterium]
MLDASGPASPPAPSGRRTLIAAALVALYGLCIWFDLPPAAGTRYLPTDPVAWWDRVQALRGWSVYPQGWAWPLIPPAPPERWLVLLAAGLLGAAVLWWARDPGHRTLLALAALVVLGYAGQLGALWLKHPNANQLLYDRITNRSFTGYFTTAIQTTDPARFFVGYADALAVKDPATRLCGHCRTHPPGPILFYWLPLQAALALSPAVQTDLRQSLVLLTGITPGDYTPPQTIVALAAAHAILLGAALLVVPLYGLARRLAGPPHALPLAALGLVLPGVLLMAPEFDQVFGTLVAALLYLCLRGLASPERAGWWGLVTGALLALCLYWSFGLWLLVVPLGALTLMAAPGGLRLWRQPDAAPVPPLPLRSIAAWVAGGTAGTLLPWLLLWGLGRFDLPRVLALTSRAHLEGITVLRPNEPWLLFNLTDFLQFAGLPLVVVTLLTLLQWRRGARPVVNLYGLLFWGLVLLLDLSGTTRAEVGRLWIFLLPLALLAVYHAVGRGRLGAGHIGGLLAAQFAVCLLIGSRWMTP